MAFAFLPRMAGAYVSRKKRSAASWTKTVKMDVAKKIQRQFVPVDMYAPTIGATQGASHVKMPYMDWPFPRSSFDQVSARTPLHS
jgi:hypothetical protein